MLPPDASSFSVFLHKSAFAVPQVSSKIVDEPRGQKAAASSLKAAASSLMAAASTLKAAASNLKAAVSSLKAASSSLKAGSNP